MPQFTGKIVSALSSIHWCTKSFVRAVERAGTNSYCDRATQITGDLYIFFSLLLPLFLFAVDERGEEYWQTAWTSPVSSSFSQLRALACFYSSDWPSFLHRTEMANITTYGRHCRKPRAIILFKHWQYIQIAVHVLCCRRKRNFCSWYISPYF